MQLGCTAFLSHVENKNEEADKELRLYSWDQLINQFDGNSISHIFRGAEGGGRGIPGHFPPFKKRLEGQFFSLTSREARDRALHDG